MARRAGVSKSVFNDVFSTVEECYQAAFETCLESLSRTVEQAASRDEAWLERVRAGLVALLGFLDDEPSWAHLLLLQTPMLQTPGAGMGLHREQRLLAVVTQLLENGGPRALSEPALPSAMTAELLAGGTFAVIRARAHTEPGDALVELAPSLMAFIVRPYLGEAAARAELLGKPAGAIEAASTAELLGKPAGASEPTAGAQPLGEPAGSGEAPASGSGPARARAISRAADLPVRATHRTTLVLRAIAQAPYSTNREVAQAAELADEGQTSKLLARLERQGVIVNVGLGPARGEPNAWVLTPSGRRTVKVINQSFASGAPRPRRARMKEVS